MEDKQILKEKCNVILKSTVGEHLIERWWNSSNKGFNDQKPIDVWETNHEKVYTYLRKQLGGEYY